MTPKARPESGAVPDDAGHALVSGVEVVVPLKELIDVDAELDKLARERKVLEQDLQRVRGKLGNENFLRNAPPDVVAKEQAKLEELKARLAKNEEFEREAGEGEVEVFMSSRSLSNQQPWQTCGQP